MDVATANYSEAGIVEYIGISMDGISGEHTLLTISLRASANAAAGSYPVTLFVGGATAAGTSGDEYITLATQAGTLTVEEGGHTYFHSYLDNYAIESGDAVTMTVYSYSTGDLAGGCFVFLYDNNLLEYKENSVELLSPMTGAEYTYTVNSSNAGRVSVAYAATEPVSTGDLLRITFIAKENVTGSAQITLSPESLTDINAAPITAESTTSTVTISEKSRVWLEVQESANTHEPFTVGFWVEGVSNLAAGDFSITYDNTALECLSVSTLSSSDISGYLVVDDAFQDGSIEFSALYPSGITRDYQLLEITFQPRYTAETLLEFVPKAETTPVNPSWMTISLDCPVEAFQLPAPNHQCENGYCHDCETDFAIISVAADSTVVSIPRVDDNATVVLAFYNNSHLLYCKFLSALEAQYAVLDSNGATHAVAFVLDAAWRPIRAAIRSN